ncbi:MFS transporter, partial [Streptomyces sp. NPDC048270]
ATLPEAVREAYRYAVAVGTHWAFLVCAAIAVLGFIAAIFIKEVPLRGAPTAPADETKNDTATTPAPALQESAAH